MPVRFADIQAAAERIKGRVVRTPFRRSTTLSDITGAEVWIKFENFQFTASFKERGAVNKLDSLDEDARRRGVIAMSAGNHAQAVAYHAAKLGVPATIVMPEPTPIVKVEYTRAHGARVFLHGDTIYEARPYAKGLAEKDGLVFIHPYDDPLIIAGQGTTALEMLHDAPDLEALVIPVGGGGLIAGNAIAAKTPKPEIEIIGVEAAMYPAMAAHLAGDTPRCGGATIAEGIAVKDTGALPLTIARALVDGVMLVEEAELERAVSLFAMVEKVVAEGAGAAGLAALLAHPRKFAGRRVGVILCGGNIDPRLLASVLTRELVRANRIASVRVAGDDRPGMLSAITRIVGSAGGNIIDVAHNRLALDVPAKGSEFDIMFETRDSAHTTEILEALRHAGYPPRRLDR
ncbi:MAG: threonine ammonia-lyase [Maricaulaceae bacterium]